MLVWLLLLAAQDVGGGVRLREWLARGDGTLTADGRPNNGTPLDVRSDLGLDDPALVHEIQGFVELPDVGRFSAGYWRLRMDGDEVLDENVNFDGRSFPAGTAVESELRVDVFFLDYEYPLLREAVDVGLILGARYLAADAELSAAGGAAQANLNRPLLLPGARVGGELASWLRADARLQGLAFSAHNVRARYVESDVELTAEPLPGLSFSLGYRHLVAFFKAREDSLNFDLDATLGGFTVALGYRF